MSEQIEINKIRTNGGTQSRATMDNETVSEYVEVWKGEGGSFPDVTLYYDGSDYWLADGFHRVESAKLAGRTTINSEVLQGTLRDAVLHSAGANSRHGLKRTNADKRRAALVLLNDDEWSKWSDRAIADKVGVSNRFVSTLRNELSVKNSQMQLPDQTRTVTRNGTTYEMTMPAKQDKKLITSNPVSSNQAIDTALLIALYNWNNAIGPALPAHLASKARTAVQIAEDLTELVRAGYATTVQSLADDGVKTAVVVTLSGCELLQKPFPAKIEQPAPETAHEILKTGDKVAILSGFGENKEAIIKEVDYSVDPVEFRVQILNDGKETIAHVKHIASNLKLIQRAGAAEQPTTHNGLKVGDVVEFHLGIIAKLGHITELLPDGEMLTECISMARGQDEQFVQAKTNKAFPASDTKYAHWFCLQSQQSNRSAVVVFAWKDHYITFDSGGVHGWNSQGFSWKPSQSWDTGNAWRISPAYIEALQAGGVDVIVFDNLWALPQRMQAIIEKVGRSRGGTIAEPAQQTPDFKVGDYVITLTGDKAEIIGINGRIINVKGRNGERKVLVENLRPASQDEPATSPLGEANQPGDTCPDCGGDLWAAGASSMINGVSYCVDCGIKRHPQKPAPLYPYTDESESERGYGHDQPHAADESVTAVTGSDGEQPIEIVLGWLMGYEIGGETTPDLLTYIEVARRWLDRLEDEISQELEPVEA